MMVTINDEDHELSSVSTISELLVHLGMKADRVAVELNRNLVSRDAWPTTRLADGDKMEIVHFVGGG